jgi:mono/diheme cytochrome c family protein
MHMLMKTVGAVLLVVVALIVAGMVYVRTTGLSARAQPGRVEARLARTVRSLATPSSVRTRVNEVPRSAEALQQGLAHFADHCATCHANDGSGQTQFGRGLFPRPPDMRARETQSLTDGELFSIIENGIRFTGMPAFGDGTAEGVASSWRLVHFIRELPRLTPAQLEQMDEQNPRSPAEIRQEIAEEEFLKGGGAFPAVTPHNP